jgi:hypothetical protein
MAQPSRQQYANSGHSLEVCVNARELQEWLLGLGRKAGSKGPRQNLTGYASEQKPGSAGNAKARFRTHVRMITHAHSQCLGKDVYKWSGLAGSSRHPRKVQEGHDG